MIDKTFNIEMTKTEFRTVTILAETPDEALRLARDQNPEFRDTGEVDEMDSEGEITDVHEQAGECEDCGKMVWDERDFFPGDDVGICRECFSKLPS